MLPRWYKPPTLTRYSGREIIARVAKLHDMTPEDITGPSKLSEHCQARFHAMRELRASGRSVSAIGRMLNRDHTTIVYGLRRTG